MANVLPQFDISLNEISKVEFSIPAYVYDGEWTYDEATETYTDNRIFRTDKQGSYIKTPFYDDVLGKRLLLIEPFGYFRILNPEIEDDGITEIKKIVALSLEDELNDASVSAWEGTFPLYDLTNPNDPDTVLGMVKTLKPSWNIGYVSSKIWSYWRTFSVSEKSLYSFLKDDIQKAFQCVFLFDTYTRTINAYTLDELATGSILSMSHDNLIKNIKTQHLDDSIVTKLEVYGAGDVDIREINPRGDNYLHNFDYFMNEKWLPEETGTDGLIAAWNAYKLLWDSKQGLYDDLMIMYRIYNSNLLNAQTRLSILENQWNGLKTRQKDYSDYGVDTAKKSLYDQVQAQIMALEPQMRLQKQAVIDAQNQFADINVRVKAVNDELQLNNNFTSVQLDTLDTITYIDKIACDSFVDNNVDFAGEPITANLINSGNLVVNGGSIKHVVNSITGISTYQFYNSNVTFNYQGQILNTATNIIEVKSCLANVQISDGTVAMMSDGTYVCSLNVTTGSIQIGSVTYPIRNGIITIAAASNAPIFIEDVRLQINGGAGNIYATEANTSLGRQKIIRELYAYAQDIFEKIAVPSFQFEIDSTNLFFLKEFQPVLHDLKMGNTVSVEIDDGKWVKPMLLGVELDYNDEAQLTLKFSNKLRFGSNEFDYAELFKESIDRGRDSTANRFDYMAFTGSNANNVISEYINSALDASKQLLQSSDNQEMILGGFGAILREANADGTFDPKQLWLTKNMIAFTRNNWDSVAAAFGEVTLNGNSYYGLIAEAMMGRKYLGNEMELMATTANGTNVAGFTFNGNGALFNNARATWTNPNGFQIVVDPTNQLFAMGSGIYAVASDGTYTPRFNPPSNLSSQTDWWNRSDLQGIQLFADGQGNMYLRGSVYAKNGYFQGTVYATDGEFTGKVTATSGEFRGNIYANDLFLRNGSSSYTSMLNAAKDKIGGNFLELDGLVVRNGGINTMSVSNGIIQFGTGTRTMTINNGGISFGSGVTLSWNNVSDKPTMPTLPGYIQSTYISSTKIDSPTINAGSINSTSITSASISSSTIQGGTIRGGKYYNLNGNAYLEVSDSSSQPFRFISRTGTSLLDIDDTGNYTQLRAQGNIIFQAGWGIVAPQGNWDFSNANVTNLNVVARWG